MNTPHHEAAIHVRHLLAAIGEVSSLLMAHKIELADALERHPELRALEERAADDM